MAIANNNYELLMVGVGSNGRISDGGVINNTAFYEALEHNTLNVTPTNPINYLPYVFIGDEAFALRTDFLKPFHERELDPERINCNNRLCRTRLILQ
jgi:hypothetical protein